MSKLAFLILNALIIESSSKSIENVKDRFHLLKINPNKGISTIQRLVNVVGKLENPTITEKKLKQKKIAYFVSWLYFLSVSLNIASLPKFINLVVNQGSLHVTPKSASIYGNIQAIDSFFTFFPS